MQSVIIPLIRTKTLVFVCLLLTHICLAGEGMWLPFLLKSLNEAEMKAMGMKMSAEDIYSVNKGSLKDAVVHFGGFCTAEVISSQGLILTNHHCGYDAIQSHSTLEKNYLDDGFWAINHAAELPNPGLFATFIIRIEDVTSAILEGTDAAMDAKTRQSVIDRNINTVSQNTTREQWQDVSIRPFFEGNNYYLFVTETYRDVRLVGAPPQSIGKFGADTDNWVWPRHTGDFSIFRIYAGPDNKPAEYSPDNKPLKPRHFLPISLDGVDEGDFTLIFGFPGRTNQYLPSFAVAQIADVIDPARIGVRDISLGIMDKHMRSDEAARLALAPKFASLANSWKKWIGEVQGLRSTKAVAKKAAEEKKFASLVQKNNDCRQYENVLPALRKLYADAEPYAKHRTIMAEVLGGSNIELFRLTTYADRLIKAYRDQGDEGYLQLKDKLLPLLDDFYKENIPAVDEEVFAALVEHLKSSLTPDLIPASLLSVDSKTIDSIYHQSPWTDKSAFTSLMGKGGAEFSNMITTDPGYRLFTDLKRIMDEKLTAPYVVLNDQIQPLLSQYMTALMRVYPDRRFWPDANNTMRVTYGNVESYSPRDAVHYTTQTYLDGIMEKYKPGDYEFDVPQKLIALYEAKDYGPYADNGKLPVCFIASNHTTGGNSGSPAIDAYGNLIGINFDRVWEGTMSDLYYDRSICRNIMVDVRYILFVIDKFADADHLLSEMKLVHPKK